MAFLGLRTARVAGLSSLLVVGCFHDSLPDLHPAGASTGSGGSATVGDPSTGAPATTGIATTDASTTTGPGTTVEPSSGPVTTGPVTTGPITTGPALDMGGPAPVTCPSDQALVACYLFDDGWDGDILIDGAPDGLHGEMSGATEVPGRRGSAAATAELTTIAVAAPQLARSAAWSVSAWVRPTAYPAGPRSGVLDRNGDYGVFVLQSGVAHCGGVPGLAGTTQLPLGTWSHITCVWEEPTAVRLYVDGALEAQSDWNPLTPPPGEPLVIGNDSPPTAEQALIGAVDEIMLWRKLLTPTDICAIADVGC